MRGHLLPLVWMILVVGIVAAPRGRSTATAASSEPSVEPRPLSFDLGERWIGNAICYGPHRDGQRPDGPGPTRDQLREDLELMLPHWNLLRTYAASEFAETLLDIIDQENLDMRVLLGVWIAPDDSAGNRREIDAAIDLTKAYPDVVWSVAVGNETQVEWSAHVCDPELLIGYLREVRASVDVPVTTSDDYNFWNKPESRAVAAEVDYILWHAHPLWNGILLEDALPWLQTQLNAVKALHPDRDIVIGETGWATSVADEGEQAELIKGEAGEAQQKEFYDAARAWAAAERQPMFIFEAFDENWKGGSHPDEVEKHWGLFHADRTPKAAMQTDDGD